MCMDKKLLVFNLYMSPLLTKSEMGGGQTYSNISVSVHPYKYKYAKSLVDTKLFCRLLRKVTI